MQTEQKGPSKKQEKKKEQKEEDLVNGWDNIEHRG
jgi:hypothetical protein